MNDIKSNNNTTSKIISHFVVLLLGGGMGFWLQPHLTDSPDTSAGLLAQKTKDSLTRVRELASPTPGGMLPFDRANYIKDKFQDELSAQQNGINTKCIVHSFADIQEYTKKLEGFFNDPDVIRENAGMTPGVALYLSSSYETNYLQIRGTDTNHLFLNNNTVFMTPVFFTEKDSTCLFATIDDKGKIRRNENIKVKVLDMLKSPFDDYHKPIADQSFLTKNARLLCDGDPEGFDLGHTNP